MEFQTINTTQLSSYLTKLDDTHGQADGTQDDCLRSQILPVPGGYTLLSAFDDYRFRGESLHNYCLYDYRTMIYKWKHRNGIYFTVDHPQYSTHSQFCRETADTIPCLTGTLLHLAPNSADVKDREKFFSILVGIFIPWHDHIPLNQLTDLWEDHFHLQSPHLSPRILRHISNIELLHKSKEESQFDRMQRQVHQASFQNFDPIRDSDDDQYDPSEESVLLPLAETVADTLTLSLEFIDFYTHEAIDATHQSGFFDAQMSEIIPDTFPILLKVSVTQAFKLLHADDILLSSQPTVTDPPPPVLPTVFVSDLNSMTHEASLIANAFTLNFEQHRAFHLIADQTLHRQGLPNQLLMSIFGEAGIGQDTSNQSCASLVHEAK